MIENSKMNFVRNEWAFVGTDNEVRIVFFDKKELQYRTLYPIDVPGVIPTLSRPLPAKSLENAIHKVINLIGSVELAVAEVKI